MGLKRERRAANSSLPPVPVAPFCFSLVLLVPLPSSPRVRVFGWRIELWIHGKGGPSLLLTSERSILIQFAGSFWICLVPFSVLVRAGSESTGQAAPGSRCLCARHPSSRRRRWWGAERTSPGTQQQEQRARPEGSARTHSSSCKAGRRFGPWHGTWQQGGKH